MDSKRFIEIAHNADLKVQSYSGRAMYGAQCIGIEHKNPILVTAIIVAQAEDDEEAEALVSVFRHARTDQMGLDMIIYFPGLKWPDNVDDDDDNEDEDDDEDGDDR